MDVLINNHKTPYQLFVELKNIRRSKHGMIKLSQEMKKAINNNSDRIFGVRQIYAEDCYLYHLFTIAAIDDMIVIKCYTIENTPYFGVKLVKLHVWEYKY